MNTGLTSKLYGMILAYSGAKTCHPLEPDIIHRVYLVQGTSPLCQPHCRDSTVAHTLYNSGQLNPSTTAVCTE